MFSPASLVNSYAGVFGVQPGISAESMPKALSSVPIPSPAGDSVTISPSANILQQLLNTEMQGTGNTDTGELDLTGLAQLKQRGEMLANMLQLKIKNFESNLMSAMKGAGIPAQDMNLKNGSDGLMLMDQIPNQDAVQGMLNKAGGLQTEFSDIAKLAEVLTMLQQSGGSNLPQGLSAAAKYAEQSVPDKVSRKSADFVMHITPADTASFSFE
ncbi:MAG: hypothetical protein LBH00_03110 [Planctomycetaceae bacterium]|jgi:hypothetical protein|nr:hypothetical protein [Planctomycetaceae bacterium]